MSLSKISSQPSQRFSDTLLSCFQQIPKSHIDGSILSNTNVQATDYRKTIAALCVFHATVMTRHKFGVQGWKTPYAFKYTFEFNFFFFFKL